jgi:AcrR family transcriptional regulator
VVSATTGGHDTGGQPDTRRALIGAAERLFAERGIDGVSLREITRAAGQRNTGALQYHFGDRDELLRAVLEKHQRDIDVHRNALLDRYELEGPDGRNDLRALAGALVLPLVSKLGDEAGGRHYLQVVAEIVNRPERFSQVWDPSGLGESMARWRRLVERLLPPEAVGRPLHRRYAAIRFATVEIAGRASGGRRRDDRLFTSHLLDLVTAVLAAPVSPETHQLLQNRQRA